MNRVSYVSCVLALIIALTISLASVSPNQAMTINRKLSGETPDHFTVTNFRISPDGQYVVYCADEVADEVFELFSVPLTGGEPTVLSDVGEHYTGCEDPDNYQITGDSQNVVYIADKEIIGKSELYIVPITGGESIKLNDTLIDGGDVIDMEITPQSITPYGYIVVYKADQEEDEKYELFGVSITGSDRWKYNGTLVINGDVASFDISPDGQWVVYRADQTTENIIELYSKPIVGEGGGKLNGPLAASRSVRSDFLITPNSQGVVFASNPDASSSKYQLYSNYINGTGGGPFELSDLNFDDRAVGDFAITPNSWGVVYIADQDTDEVDELYSNFITGGTPYKLSGDLGNHGEIISFKIASHSQGVAFMFKNTSEIEIFYQLYSNFITGGDDPIFLGTNLVPVGVPIYTITNNGMGVVYMAAQETENVIDLFSNRLSGGWVKKINSSMVTDGDVYNFLITPNNMGVVYSADQDTNGQLELYSNSIVGGTSNKLNGPLVENGNVTKGFLLTPNGQSVIYRADQELNNKFELYISHISHEAFLPTITR